MNKFLNKFGIWDNVINPPTPSNKKRKSVAHNEAKKDNTTTLNFLMYGFPSLVKEIVGEYTSSKYLWFNLESNY